MSDTQSLLTCCHP